MKQASWISRIDVLIPALLSLLGLLLILAGHYRYGMTFKELVGPAATALVAIFGTASAARFSYRADRRTMIGNAFEIARRWDDAHYLEARDATRDKATAFLVDRLRLADPSINKAFVHYTNLFWEMAIAIQSGLADEEYLRERFRKTLEGFHPCFEQHLNNSKDPGAQDALAAIKWLHQRWTGSLVADGHAR